MPEPAAAAAPRPSEGYLRVLSLFDATMIVIGSIIGAGIFFTPHDIALETQREGAMMGVWLLGGVIALSGALTYAELGGLFPRAGGVYVFLREAYGGLAAFLYGWAILFVIAPGAVAWVADKVAENLAVLIPAIGPRGKPIVALATILLLTALNVRGVRWGSLVQNVFGVAKLAAIFLMIVAGLFFAGAQPLPPTDADVPVPRASPAVGFLAGMVPVLFSYGGWQNGTYIAAEVKNPRRNVPLSMVIGTVVVVLTYVLINVSFLRLLSPAAIADDKTFASRAAVAVLGPAGGSLLTAGILVSVFSICAAMLLTNPRVAQAMGEDGLFFRAFGRMHPHFRTPAFSTAVLGLWSCVLLLSGRSGDLLGSVVFADWLFFSLVAGSLFVFRRKLPHAERPYRCPLYPFVPGLFLGLAAAMTVSTILTSTWPSRIMGAGVLLVGVAAYYAYRLASGSRRPAP